jgi:adenylate cyclase
MSQTRRLAAILAADVAGYSRLIGADESGTLKRLAAIRAEVTDPKIAEHHGRIVKTMGDGLLVEFASVVDALHCAAAIQTAMAKRNTAVATDDQIEFRIGINVGDIVVQEGDIFGDGVNIAARLEALADPGAICVSARVQEDAAGKLDLAFDDIGEQQLKNIARPVRAYRVVTGTRPAMPQVSTGPPLPDKPSIAVLPFTNLSGDPEQEYFADGMVEEIITNLSRIRWLFVIARNSSFTYKGQAVDVKRVGRELGVRYVLEGSVRKAGGRVRITAQLIDGQSGAHLWADRFDGALDEVFELQDRIAISVAGIIEPTRQAAEMRRSADLPTSDLTAYDLYLRGVARFFPATQQRILEALDFFQQAIGRDPNFGPALAWAAICQLRLYLDGWTEQPETAIRKGREFAHQALEAAASDPETVANAVFPLAYFGEDLSAMKALIDNALALNPSFARGWFCSGHVRLLAGDLETAVEHSENSLRISPRIRMGSHYHVIGMAYFFMRKFEEAIAKLLVSVQEYPGMPVPLRFLIAAYAHTGRLDAARDGIRRLRVLTPVVIHPATYVRNPDHRELILSGLRLGAGEVT